MERIETVGKEGLHQLLHLVPDASILVKADQTIALANRQAERLFGYQPGGLLGENAEKLFPGAAWSTCLKSLSRVVEDQRAAPVTGKALNACQKDGHSLPVEISLCSLTIEKQPMTVVSIRDASERKSKEAALACRHAELVHASRISGMADLSASLAHELNQPLTAILANTRAIQRFLQNPQPDLGEVGHVLEDIVEDDKRAARIVRRYRSFLELGERHTEELDLNEMVGDVVLFLQNKALIHHVTIEVMLAEGLGNPRGDRIELHHVVMHLMTNAMDAMTHDKESRSLTVRTFSCEDRGVGVAVRDRGPGIDPEASDRLFDPFFTTKKRSAGIGLFICRNIIEAHGGSLWHTPNQDGPGVTFSFSLPVR